MALRIASKPGTKDYGVLSVLTLAYYDCTYLFDVHPESFNPPPKVMSGIVHLKRREQKTLNCDEQKFKQVVKAAFNQRRKTMRNSLKSVVNDASLLSDEIFNLRPEQLSVKQFEDLTNMLYK